MDFPILSRGTVKLLDTNLFTIGARLRLDLRLQAGDGKMSVNEVPLGTVPTDSVTEAVNDVPLGTVPTDSVTEEFAGRP